MAAKQQLQMSKVLSSQKSALKALSKLDYERLFELDAKLKASKALLKEFTKDPARVAKREVGLVAPKGIHLHFVDKNNNYFPAEGDAISQLHKATGKPWTRVEIRVGGYQAGGCTVGCGICW